MEHLEALFAVAVIEMAEAQARIADHLDERGMPALTSEQNEADRRFFLRELRRELERRGDEAHPAELAEVAALLGEDSDELVAADEALLAAWAARNNFDVAAIRASRVRRIQSHLRWVEMTNRILKALPADEARRVIEDLQDDGTRTPLTQRVRDAANRWAERTEEPVADTNATAPSDLTTRMERTA